MSRLRGLPIGIGGTKDLEIYLYAWWSFALPWKGIAVPFNATGFDCGVPPTIAEAGRGP